jgi:putative ATP-dependent endonuclease of OLD family
MHLHKVEIENYRLLKKVELLLEERTTVIVGRNNSGKTSLTALFENLLSESSPSFLLEDFSLSAHEAFWNAFVLRGENKPDEEVRAALPAIEIKLTVKYQKGANELGPLSDFIVELNPDCTDALIVIRYELRSGDLAEFFAGLTFEKDKPFPPQKEQLCRTIKEKLQKHFSSSVLAVDPNDSSNVKSLDWSRLRAVMLSGFINAQRGLDDVPKDRDVLAKVLEDLLNTAMSDAADPKDKDIAAKLKDAVKGVQDGIDGGFNLELRNLLPAFSLFGYPGIGDPDLRTETTLDVERLLKNHTWVHYAGLNGINLPEAYNGLGARNLIFILLRLLDFFKVYRAQNTFPNIHLVFIEEPEVHLHPQMQEVFIAKLHDIAKVFADEFNKGVPWPVQFVVTTHSSHLANKAPFDAMRYFLARAEDGPSKLRRTEIKDLRKGLSGKPREDREFLHKYMTLTRCDLLFADKAILIEGTTERLLLPKMIEKMDAEDSKRTQLSSEYLSTVEVGGAYAHLFFDLVEFLDLKTLIITDLDSTKKNADNKYIACMVSEGTNTSNACIKRWFGDNVMPDELSKKTSREKIVKTRRIAYQISENDVSACGRSFEAAFVLCNRKLFGFGDLDKGKSEIKAWEDAERIQKKSDFALAHAIEHPDWSVPLYILEGLRWLAESEQPAAPLTADAGAVIKTTEKKDSTSA